MTGPEQPLSADALDELLSADIDGELDRAAVELGLAPEAARAALEASPAAGARRDALLQARALLAATTALEPAAEARLVAVALARATDERQAAGRPAVTPLSTNRPRNAWRVLVGVGTAAAVIAGVVALSATNPAGDKMSSSSTKRSDAPTVGSGLQNSDAGQSIVFGEITPGAVLRGKVRHQLASSAATAPTAKAAQRAGTTIMAGAIDGNTAYAPENGASTPAPTGADSTAAYSTRRNCIGLLGRTEHVPGTPVLSGTATFGTKPAFVVVYRQADSYLVYVLSATDCSVVSRDTLP
jgi:hypothetical protein